MTSHVPYSPLGMENMPEGPRGGYGHPNVRAAPHPNGHAFHGVGNHGDPGLSGLVNSFQQFGMSAHNMGHSGSAPQMNHPPAYMMPDGHYVVAPMPSGSPIDGYNHGVSPFAHPAGPFTGYVGVPFLPVTPGRAQAAHPRQDRSSEVPPLETRRGSYSTNESTPATPYYTGVAQRDNGPRVANIDRSTYTTPSPQQVGVNSLQGVDAKANLVPAPTDRVLEELLKQDPAIPKAVPAVFTPPGQIKSVDQSLENRIPGNRNVYIRGLHPTTDDGLLKAFATRFGAVECSKAIIDTATGACKGFGFAKFYDVRHSEMCIRGFHRLGYEVGFARESFNSRLKAEGDETSTNLYISNLPKSVDEMQLAVIFNGFEILSSKILRDSMGNSRGVGFARFESRDICDQVIKMFHGASVGDEGLLMNIRYADTPSQKELKRITAERRQFRTNEYNIGAYGTPLVGYLPNTVGQSGWRRPSVPSVPSAPSVPSVSTPGPTHTARLLDPPELMRGTVVNSLGDMTNRPDGHHRSRMQRRAQSSSDEPIRTPCDSDASDEGVTIRVEPAAAKGSTQSSPVVKKEN